MRTLAPQYPELAGMHVRDLRSVAKTTMINARVSELAVNRILGHSDGVAGRYYELTDAVQREALGHLSTESRSPDRSRDEVESAGL